MLKRPPEHKRGLITRLNWSEELNFGTEFERFAAWSYSSTSRVRGIGDGV